MKLLDRFQSILKNKKMLLPKRKVFVACSGGSDSVALVYLLNSIAEDWNSKPGLLHFNHGLRGQESDKDEAYVRQLAKKLGWPVYVGRSTTLKKKAKKERESIEETARKLRYAFFEKAAEKHEIHRVMLAHHQEDQAETVLMRVLKGTGRRGLSGIRQVLKKGKVTYIRPLLDFSKSELTQFLKAKKIKFRKDKSNQSTRFDRNKIRLKVLPRLAKDINPRVTESLARIASIVEEENKFLSEVEEASWKRAYLKRAGQKIYLKRSVFSASPAAIQFRLIDRALQRIDPKSGLNFEAWRAIQGHLGRRKYRHSLPKDIDLSLTSSQITIYRKK